MLRVLGRNTSGNVQKVIWLLEELGAPYKREDYGRQFNNTAGCRLSQAQSQRQGADPGRWRHGGLGIEHDPALSRQQAGQPRSIRPMPPARSQVERWMDWQLASLNNPYLAIFRTPRNRPRSARQLGDRMPRS